MSRSELHRSDSQLDVLVAGQHDDRQLRCLGFQPREHLNSDELGKLEIQDDEVRLLDGGAREAGFAVLDARHLESLPSQDSLQQSNDGGIVVDDEHAASHGSLGHQRLNLPGRLYQTFSLRRRITWSPTINLHQMRAVRGAARLKVRRWRPMS